MISSLPQRIGVIFHEKLFITLPILLVFKLNLVPRCVLYVLLCVLNLEAIQLGICILWQFLFFLLVCENKKKKKTKNVSTFLKVYISGMACAMYFRSGMCSVMICWHLHIEFGLVITKLCTYVKSYFFSTCYYTHAVRACSFSWAAQHSTVCTSSYHQ